MDIFIGLNEIQWIGLSTMASILGGIATTTGVLIALFRPIRVKKKERDNLIYFISKEIEIIVSIVMRLNPDDLDNDESEATLLYQSKQVQYFLFYNWDKYSEELAKYDRELFILFDDIIAIARATKSSVDLWLNAKSESDKDAHKPLLKASLLYLHADVSTSISLLRKKYKLLNHTDSAAGRFANKLYFNACNPVD